MPRSSRRNRPRDQSSQGTAGSTILLVVTHRRHSGSSRVAPIANGISRWSNRGRLHDRHILLPFAGLLQHYGLSPRVLPDLTIAWDDLSIPTFQVVRVSPLAVYKSSGSRPP